MSRSRLLALIAAGSVAVALAAWSISVSFFWRDNGHFAEALLPSAASDTPLHRELLPPSELVPLTSQRHLLAGKPRQVLADETWGALEFGYCLPSNAYAYITFATEGSPPKPASLTVYEPGNLRSRICAAR